VDATLSEWLNLLVRWFHVVAGITWLGQTYLFNRLEGRFAAAAREAGGPEAVWLVHSGGFYVVAKETSPARLPRTLHWFKWESALTWISGFLLLLIVYYGGGLMVTEETGFGRAVAAGLGLLVFSWPIYDGLCRSPLGRSEAGTAVVGFALIVAVAWGLTRFLSGRAAYIHVGAMFGTIMAANVWSLILPTQRRMIALLAEGKRLDPAMESQAMLRTRHNTYLSVPVVFLMLSNHFPTVSYGHAHNWIMLGMLVLLGWAAAHVMRRL
jgi:uncharacterized membrane protein